jgi:prepilin-type N-terminal cleavage/methylation domain-containing protein/prepilin-type processing-associated H-X9-DG protein
MRHRAFTLMELLVVIAVLALLMAMLSPVLSRVRRRAQTVVCSANIRQLLISLHDYDAAHQSLPYGFDFVRMGQPPGGPVGDQRIVLPGWWWFHYTGVLRYKSREEMKVLQCPSKRLDDPLLDRSLVCGNYGVNRALCKSPWALPPYEKSFVGAPLSLDRLQNSGSTLLLVDSGYGLTCWWQATAEPPAALKSGDMENTAYIPGLEINRDRPLRTGQAQDAKGGRHPNRTVNVGYADGHVDSKPASELLVEKTGAGAYTNMLLWQGQPLSSAGVP